MKITKYGHSCLLIEEGSVRIITDPGDWNPLPDVENIAAILITHEHGDHFDSGKVKDIISRSPDAVVVTQGAVAKLLADLGIPAIVLEEGKSVEVQGVSIESFGHDHAIIYGDTVPCQNTGFLIAGKLFIPGDALHDVPSKPVDILALPTGGPWMRISEAIDYAKKVKPRIAFPIHDAMHTEEYKRGFIPHVFANNLSAADIGFRDLAEGATAEF